MRVDELKKQNSQVLSLYQKVLVGRFLCSNYSVNMKQEHCMINREFLRSDFPAELLMCMFTNYIALLSLTSTLS